MSQSRPCPAQEVALPIYKVVCFYFFQGRQAPASVPQHVALVVPAPWGTGHQKEFPQTLLWDVTPTQLTSCQSSGSLGPARERKEAGGEFLWRRLDPITPGFTSQTDCLPKLAAYGQAANLPRTLVSGSKNKAVMPCALGRNQGHLVCSQCVSSLPFPTGQGCQPCSGC